MRLHSRQPATSRCRVWRCVVGPEDKQRYFIEHVTALHLAQNFERAPDFYKHAHAPEHRQSSKTIWEEKLKRIKLLAKVH